MKTRVLWTILMAFALTFTLAVSAYAQDDHRDNQNQQADQNRDNTRSDQNRDNNHADRADNQNWENRNGWETRTYERDQHPEGWNQGQRAESRYCGGHDGCYTYSNNGAPYYYYRDENGRLIVRRRHHHDDNNSQYREDHHDRDEQH